MAGKQESPRGKLRCVASKLGKYADETDNPYQELDRYSDRELAKHLAAKSSEELLSTLFEQYEINCMNMHRLDSDKPDELIGKLEGVTDEKEKIILQIVSLIRSVSDVSSESAPIVDSIKNTIGKSICDDLSVKEISERLGISRYYMCHLFKRTTGIIVIDYKNEMKLTRAKEMLLQTDQKIADIAYACGFGSSSYFGKVFLASEHISPSRYRSLHRRIQK